MMIGRPITGRERKQRFQIMLEPYLAKQLREMFNGNLSVGVAVAVHSYLTGPGMDLSPMFKHYDRKAAAKKAAATRKRRAVKK
jgi:hypothetical protein